MEVKSSTVRELSREVCAELVVDEIIDLELAAELPSVWEVCSALDEDETMDPELADRVLVARRLDEPIEDGVDAALACEEECEDE